MDVDEYSEDQYSPEAPDVFYLRAQEDIKALYESDRSKVYFVRQLQVKYEKEYFHWITHHAIKTLLQFGYIREERSLIRKGNHISFLIHHANRYPKRAIKEIAEIIKEYSQDHITRSCGNLAEDLFCKAMSKKGVCH